MSSENFIIFDLFTIFRDSMDLKNGIFLVETNKKCHNVTFLDLLQGRPNSFFLVAVNIFLKFILLIDWTWTCSTFLGAYRENVPPTHGLRFSEFFANFLFFFLSNFWDESSEHPPPSKIILCGCTYQLCWPGCKIRCWRYALCINDTRVWCARAHPQHVSVQFNTLEILSKNIPSFIFCYCSFLYSFSLKHILTSILCISCILRSVQLEWLDLKATFLVYSRILQRQLRRKQNYLRGQIQIFRGMGVWCISIFGSFTM